MSTDDKFNQWNERKKEIHKQKTSPHAHEQEIWWSQLGQNVSTEICGKGKKFFRPVLILKQLYSNACFAIPISSKIKAGTYYYSFIDTKGVHQRAILSQTKYLDMKRLSYKLSSIKNHDFEELKKKFQELIK